MNQPRRIPELPEASSHYYRIIDALGSTRVSRRSLLIGLAASPSFLPLVGYAARAASNFSVRHDQRSIEIGISGVPAWRLDTSWFDGDPKLDVVSTQDSLRVDLSNAYFPGTDISALLSLRARRSDMGWEGELLLPALKFSARMRFDEWLLGLEPARGAFSLPKASFRAMQDVALSGLSGQLLFRPDWCLWAERLDGGRINISPQSSNLSAWTMQLPDATPGLSKLPRRSWLLVPLDGYQTIPFGSKGPVLELRGKVNCFIDTGRTDAQWVIDSDTKTAAVLRWQDKCTMDVNVRSVIVTRTSDAQSQVSIAEVIPAEDWVRFNRGAVQLQDFTYQPFVITDESSCAKTYSNKRTIISPFVDRFVVALQGCDQAILESRVNNPIDVTALQPATLLDFAKQDIPLGAYDLILRRAVDGLYCRVRFREVQLRQNQRGWYLYANADKESMLEFDFGSQHLREEAMYFTDCCKKPSSEGSDDFPVSDEVAALTLIQLVKDKNHIARHEQFIKDLSSVYKPDQPIEQFIALLKSDKYRDNYKKFRKDPISKGRHGEGIAASIGMRSEAAGASHLTFSLSKGEKLLLNMDALFSWAAASKSNDGAKLKAVFSKRAVQRGVPSLEDATLNEVVIDPASLAQPQPAIGDPSHTYHEYATRIEAPAHLVVSPIPARDGSKDGSNPQWKSPSPALGGTADSNARAELWSARLSSVEMRALYSSRMTFESQSTSNGRVLGGKVKMYSPPPPYPFSPPGREVKDFRASYDSRDLHELVCLTAVYNAPALCGSKQVQKCNSDGGPRVPSYDLGSNPSTGVFIPEPMRAELLMLTSQGATFRYRGTWSPPASSKSEGALTLKRYNHDAHLGRDSEVRFEYKGFLFPLGQPATLVKETQRKFCLEKDKWVARLVQRFYIHVPAFKRSFKAVGQVHDRLWGHAETGMRSFTTPDLDKSESSQFLESLGSSVFWPRVPRKGGDSEDVIFEFEDTLTSTTYAAPLVFVDNDVAHQKEKLKEVIDEWRKQVKTLKSHDWKKWPAEPKRYFATVTSAKLPYLPGVRSENTDIETSRILLGVAVPLEDRYNDEPVASANDLSVTPRMEAEDQPPFYPVRRRALIAPTSLAILTGNSAQRFLMEYDPGYLKHGFDGTHNAAKVFGVFVDKDHFPHMNFGEDTSRSGGFVSPSAKIVWMSQSRGPMGGPTNRIVPLEGSNNSQEKVEGNQPSATSIATQEDHPDSFDPKKYFAEALGDAKLLGVVRLVDVLEVLLVATGTEVPTIKRQDLYDLALPALRSALAFMRNQLDAQVKFFEIDPNSQNPIDIAKDRLRPDWNRLMSDLKAAERLVNSDAPDPALVLAAANDIGAACNRFAATVRTLINDPAVLLPEALQTFVSSARVALNQLKQLMPPKKYVETLKKVAEGVAKATLRTQLRTLVTDLGNMPAYARVRAALIRIGDKLDELEAASQSEQKALTALRDNLFGGLVIAAKDVEEQIMWFKNPRVFFGPISMGSNFESHVVEVIKDQVDYALKHADGVAQRCADACEAVEMAITEYERLHPEQASLHASARQGLVLLSHTLNAEADSLLQLKTASENIKMWSGSFKELNEASQNSLGLVALEYVLLTPERVFRCLEAFEQIGEGIPEAAYVRLAADWLEKAQPQILLKRCASTLSALAAALPLNFAFLLKQINSAAEIANSIMRKFESLFVKVTHEQEEKWVLREEAKNELRKRINKIIDNSGNVTRGVVEPVQDLLSALRALSSAEVEALVRTALEKRLNDVSIALQAVVESQKTINKVGTEICECIKLGTSCDESKQPNEQPAETSLKERLNALHVSSYLSEELRNAINDLVDAIDKCSGDKLHTLVSSAVHVWDLLSRAASSGDIAQLADLDKIMQDVIAQLGVPTRVRINYDWATTVTETPKGNSAIFEPLGGRKLRISSVMETSLTSGRPSVQLDARLDPFAIHLFGKVGASNFLSIHFDELRLSARPGRSLECITDVTSVRPGAALGFINRLSSVFGARSGFYLLPGIRGIEVGYMYSKPYEVLGGFVLQNIDFSISASLPFDNSPVRTTLKLADKEKPFLISAGIYGGGGFLGVRTRADMLELLEASFEYGAVTGFRFGPVSGSGRITAGIYILMSGRLPLIEGFFCAAGEASIAGLIHISAMLRVGLRYDSNTGQTSGQAVFTFKFSLGIFDFSYSARVAYAKSGDSAGGAQASLPSDKKIMLAALGNAGGGIVADAPSQIDELISSRKAKPSRGEERYAGLLRLNAWKQYWTAFNVQQRPLRHQWMSLCQVPKPASRKYKPEARSDRVNDLNRVDWYVIPWGKNGSNLRASLRIMPVVLDAHSSARTDWPKLLANTESVQLKLFSKTANGGYEPIEKTILINIGERYRARLEEWGLTVEDAQRIWEAIFPPALGTPSEKALHRQKGKQYAFHHTGSVATEATRTAGQIFADACGFIDCSQAASKRNYVAPVAASANLAKTLKGMSAAYVPVTGRRQVTDPTAPAASTSEVQLRGTDGELDNWLKKNVLGLGAASGITVEATKRLAPSLATVPYSIKAINTIRGTSNGLKDELAKNFVLRQAAYSPEAISSPALKSESESDPDNFHKRLAGLISHPWLMKVLGLVVDIEFELTAEADAVCVDTWGNEIKPNNPLRTMIWSQFGYAQSNCSNVQDFVDLSHASLTQLDTDRTPYRLMQTAVAWNNEIVAGLNPSSVQVRLQPQETVGLSLIERKEDANPLVLQEDANSKGLSLAERTASSNSVEKIEADKYVDLYLEQLSIGFRPDIQELVPNQDPAGASVGPFTSLTARRIRRVLLQGRDVTDMFQSILGRVDEGMILEAVRHLDPSDPGSGYFVEEELFRWGTWMMGVPRPDSDGAPQSELPKGMQFASTATAVGGLVIEYEACPGATPQRYGHGYRVGLRRVMADGNSMALEDVAYCPPAIADNNSIALEDADRDNYCSMSIGGKPASDGIEQHTPFLRYEPIAPPVVLIQGLPRDGSLLPEKAQRTVVTLEDRTRSRRVLVPPRCTSIDLAIRHGMFDNEIMRKEPPPSAFADVVLTRDGDFPSFLFAYTGIGGGNTEELYFRRLAGGAPPPTIPYYPDPWARRAILAFYRASDDRLLYIDHFDYYPPGRKWPDAQELEIEVVPALTVEDPVRGFEIICEVNRRIIRVAPGVHLKLRVWHEIDVEMLNQSAVVDQIVQAARLDKKMQTGLGCIDGSMETIRGCVIERLSQWDTKHAASNDGITVRPAYGCSSELLNMTSFWMLNPFQEIEVLHATELPLRPAFLSESIRLVRPNVARSPSHTSSIEDRFMVMRNPAETSVNFKGHVRLDRSTTSHVDAQAFWRDNAQVAMSGKGASKLVKVEDRQGLLFQLRDIAPIAIDTKGTPPASPMAVELDACQHLQCVDGIMTTEDQKTRPLTTPYDFGDTRARVIEVTLLAQARHANEFKTPKVGADPDRFIRRSKPQRVVVPGSQHPEPPRVEYVMPLLAWNNVTKDRVTQRTREPGWFRIWLGNEWYTSGNGELLALVCWPPKLFKPLDRGFQLSLRRRTQNQFEPPDKLVEPFITRWGLDPLANQSGLKNFGNIPASAFRNRLRHRAQMANDADDTVAVDLHHLQDVDTFEPQVDLSMLPGTVGISGSEHEKMKAVLALYRPKFDRDTGRWYADIQIDPQYAYKPFLRIALARWQAHALHKDGEFDLRLSRVITSEFVQLMPGRSVTITPLEGKKGQREYDLTIEGSMLGPRGTEWRIGVEQHHPDWMGGTWVPLANPAVKKTQARFKKEALGWTISVPDKLNARYSVVLEEIETLSGKLITGEVESKTSDCKSSEEGRLVFFDRIELANYISQPSTSVV